MTEPKRNEALVIIHSPTAVYGPPLGVVQNPTDFAPIYVPHEALVQRHFALEARVSELERACAPKTKRRNRVGKNDNGR